MTKSTQLLITGSNPKLISQGKVKSNEKLSYVNNKIRKCYYKRFKIVFHS